jgi:hypothetical protein
MPPTFRCASASRRRSSALVGSFGREPLGHRQGLAIGVQPAIQVVANLLHVADADLQQRHAAPRRAARLVGRRQFFVQRERFSVALEARTPPPRFAR